MRTGKPNWYLKTICPCCGQGLLLFVVCPICEYLTVKCLEMGDTFANPNKLENWFTETCPTCRIETSSFIPANSDHINKASFDKSRYE